MDLTDMTTWATSQVAGLADTLTPVKLLERTADILHQLIDFDACANTTLDPQSWLPSSGTHIEGFPASSCGPYWDAEYLHPDPVSFSALHAADEGVVTLHRVTDGQPDSSRRHREVLRPLSLDAELRATCTVDGQLFGALDLVRGDGMPDFTADDMRIVEAVTPVLAGRLRQAVVLRPVADAMAHPLADAMAHPLAAAVIILDGQGDVLSMTSSAQMMLDMVPEPLREPPSRTGRLHGVVHAIWARARFLAGGFEAPAASARVRLADGRWMTLTGTCTRTPDGVMGHTVVVLEPTPTSQLGPMMLAAHELTTREAEIVGLLLRSDSAQQIGTALQISIHTVRTHIKRIHEKLGISSRAELTRLFIDEEFLPNAEVIAH